MLRMFSLCVCVCVFVCYRDGTQVLREPWRGRWDGGVCSIRRRRGGSTTQAPPVLYPWCFALPSELKLCNMYSVFHSRSTRNCYLYTSPAPRKRSGPVCPSSRATSGTLRENPSFLRDRSASQRNQGTKKVPDQTCSVPILDLQLVQKVAEQVQVVDLQIVKRAPEKVLS